MKDDKIIKAKQHEVEKMRGQKRHTIVVDAFLLKRFDSICKTLGLGHASAGITSMMASVVEEMSFKTFFGLHADKPPVFITEIANTLEKLDKHLKAVNEKAEEARAVFKAQNSSCLRRITKLEMTIKSLLEV